MTSIITRSLARDAALQGRRRAFASCQRTIPSAVAAAIRTQRPAVPATTTSMWRLQPRRHQEYHSTSSAPSSVSANKKLETNSSGPAASASIPVPSSCRHKKYVHTLNEETPYQLCFLRHGQSTWNRDNRFIGWTDTPLTDDGVLEARVAGQMLRRSGIRFDEVHTSLLRRSIRTANLVLMELHQEYLPVHKHWRLNERSYGDLVGQHKKEAVKKFGKDQVKAWRRSFDIPPPEMDPPS